MSPSRSRLRLVVFFLATLASCAAGSAPKSESTAAIRIFLVRHAEKDLTPGLTDPSLTPEGQQRAEALRDALRKYPVAALYTTDTLRTRATLAPLAASLKLEPKVYDAKQPVPLAERLREQHRGQTIVVVGHANTLLSLIDALGASRPVPTLSDADYDYLFEVTLPAKGPASVRASHYGAPAHTDAAPK